ANADKDTVVHSNLLQFVLMLGYGLKRGLKVLGPSELHPLACDKVIIPLLWRGVVSKKLQPRMIGSLKETRSQLAELLGSEELLAVPDWWDNAASRTSS
ncbi:MAG TPA: hypothetical protein VFG71_11960, partial [Nitrospiraceae bacterium]|nr:hypothetical protein [Nitrospiraceae bacterium]